MIKDLTHRNRENHQIGGLSIPVGGVSIPTTTLEDSLYFDGTGLNFGHHSLIGVVDALSGPNLYHLHKFAPNTLSHFLSLLLSALPGDNIPLPVATMPSDDVLRRSHRSLNSIVAVHHPNSSLVGFGFLLLSLSTLQKEPSRDRRELDLVVGSFLQVVASLRSRGW
ncbi:hypothetical protein CRG98_035753 [Punica granatum]|uniref:Uncharacterized protein n=1 Tax=Punica granatum TaxID=22663 RepID=A0A2I0IIR8_PUNGR|nr:hypothetical protein CRG98_035753 [Punica granatum]